MRQAKTTDRETKAFDFYGMHVEYVLPAKNPQTPFGQLKPDDYIIDDEWEGPVKVATLSFKDVKGNILKPAVTELFADMGERTILGVRFKQPWIWMASHPWIDPYVSSNYEHSALPLEFLLIQILAQDLDGYGAEPPKGFKKPNYQGMENWRDAHPATAKWREQQDAKNSTDDPIMDYMVENGLKPRRYTAASWNKTRKAAARRAGVDVEELDVEGADTIYEVEVHVWGDTKTWSIMEAAAENAGRDANVEFSPEPKGQVVLHIMAVS